MRISIPIDRWDPNRGGAERYLDRLIRELEARGHEVTVLCLQSRPTPPGDWGPRIEALEVPRFPRWRRELGFAEAAVKAHRRSGREVLYQVRHALAADIYQPHGGSFIASRAAQGRSLAPALRLARELLASLRPTHHVLKMLDRAVFERSPNLTTLSVSAKVEADIRQTYPDLSFRFVRLPNPVDTERLHDRDRRECRAQLQARLGIRAQDRIALFAAHHFRPKGLAHAIQALCPAPGWHLIVAGRDASGPFQRLSRRLDVAARTHFVGAIPDLRAFYAGSDAFVLPTYYDPCSLSVLEALACGTPAITTRDNGASEVLTPGVSGFILDRPEDSVSIANALQTVEAQGPVLREGAMDVARGLSWSNHIDRVEIVLSEIARVH